MSMLAQTQENRVVHTQLQMVILEHTVQTEDLLMIMIITITADRTNIPTITTVGIIMIGIGQNRNRVDPPIQKSQILLLVGSR